MERSKRRNLNNGITMIVLVITIIVLLILAGVSIAMLVGPNGIITQANEAKTEYEKEAIKEEIRVGLLGKKLEQSRDLTESEIKEFLSEYGDVIESEDGKIEGIQPKGKEYEIPYKEIIDEEPSNGGTGDEGSSGSGSGGGSEGSDKVEVSKEEFEELKARLNELEERSNTTSTNIDTINANIDKMGKEMPRYNQVDVAYSCEKNSTDWYYTGYSITIPANSYYDLTFLR